MVSLLAFTSCASEYKIEGSSSVSRLDGKMLFVKVPSGDRMLSIDSAEVIHGMFKMEGITDSTSMASLYMDDESIMPFVIEKGKISISIDNARIVVTGTPLNDIQREITREREKLAAEMNALAKEFIQKNYDNVLGPGVFIMLCSNFPYPVMTPLIEEIIEEAPDRFKNNSVGQEYVTVARANLEKLKAPHE